MSKPGSGDMNLENKGKEKAEITTKSFDFIKNAAKSSEHHNLETGDYSSSKDIHNKNSLDLNECKYAIEYVINDNNTHESNFGKIDTYLKIKELIVTEVYNKMIESRKQLHGSPNRTLYKESYLKAKNCEDILKDIRQADNPENRDTALESWLTNTNKILSQATKNAFNKIIPEETKQQIKEEVRENNKIKDIPADAINKLMRARISSKGIARWEHAYNNSDIHKDILSNIEEILLKCKNSTKMIKDNINKQREEDNTTTNIPSVSAAFKTIRELSGRVNSKSLNEAIEAISKHLSSPDKIDADLLYQD